MRIKDESRDVAVCLVVQSFISSLAPRLILAPFEMVLKRHLVTSTKSTSRGLQRYITSERPEAAVSPRWRGTMQSTTGKTSQALVQLASGKAGYAPKLCSAWFVISLLLYGYSPRGLLVLLCPSRYETDRRANSSFVGTQLVVRVLVTASAADANESTTRKVTCLGQHLSTTTDLSVGPMLPPSLPRID